MEKSKPCPICQGTGFANGKLCPCVTGEKPAVDLPEGWQDIFGDIFSATKGKKKGGK
jgi:hypothetical protein